MKLKKYLCTNKSAFKKQVSKIVSTYISSHTHTYTDRLDFLVNIDSGN